DIEITARLADDWLHFLRDARSDDAGQFRIDGLTAGTYQLWLTGPDWKIQTQPGSVSVAPDATTGNVTLHYTRPEGLAISGVVQTTDGTPIAHATVGARDGNRNRSSYSGKDGRFFI